MHSGHKWLTYGGLLKLTNLHLRKTGNPRLKVGGNGHTIQ